MTLNKALGKVREIISDDPFWTDDNIKDWLNDGYLSFFEKRGIEESWSSDVTNLTRVAVPVDMFKIFEIYYLPTGATTKLLIEDTDYKIFDNFIDFNYSLTGTIYIEGERRPETLTDLESFELPERLQIGIVDYAISIAFLKDEDNVSANQYYALYLQKVKEWERTPTFRTVKWRDNWYKGVG